VCRVYPRGLVAGGCLFILRSNWSFWGLFRTNLPSSKVLVPFTQPKKVLPVLVLRACSSSPGRLAGGYLLINT
jgi:hypothetical protein